MCRNGTYPFLSATLVRQLPYYLFRETCFMDSYLAGGDLYHVSEQQMSLEKIYFSLIDREHAETERENT